MRIGILLLLFALPLYAQQPWMLDFEKPAVNPVLQADSLARFTDPRDGKVVAWQRADVFNPGAVVHRDTIFLLFRAEDDPDAIIGGRTSRIGLAWSTDGLNFSKFPEPVLYPDLDEQASYDQPGGVEDPRVVALEDGRYLMLYTSWDRSTARLSAATSRDLRNWDKHGPVFREAYGGKYLNHWSKSGAVVTKLEGDRLLAARVNGLYYMYWGELFVNVATSADGINWTPMLDPEGNLLRSFLPRAGEFDSHLVEPGPPALLTEQGILLFYNGKNAEGAQAASYVAPGTYCGGQALFRADAPEVLLSRLETPFICPSLPHERRGQYQQGTTFIQGLVFYRKHWFLYYGTADSMVGVAVKQ